MHAEIHSVVLCAQCSNVVELVIQARRCRRIEEPASILWLVLVGVVLQSDSRRCANAFAKPVRMRQAVDALRDLLQSFRPVIDRRTWTPCWPAALALCRCCWWPSRGECVARAFGARGEGRAAARIFGNADEPAGHVAFEFIARGEERRVRSAVAQRHAKSLRAADGNVRAKFARRLDERERQQIRGDT